MKTLLNQVHLRELLDKPVLFDANIFMVGIENRTSDKNCSFENMKNTYIIPLLESFSEIYIHQEVYKELDDDARGLIDLYIGRNVTIVDEQGLYGKDPKYTTIFNHIAKHELVHYERGRSKDRGEVYSLAYAAYHDMNYFCSKEIMVDRVAEELDDLEQVGIITFDIIVLNAYIYYARKQDKTYAKALKAIYKRYCGDVIKRHKLPQTLSDYIVQCQDYL